MQDCDAGDVCIILQFMLTPRHLINQPTNKPTYISMSVLLFVKYMCVIYLYRQSILANLETAVAADEVLGTSMGDKLSASGPSQSRQTPGPGCIELLFCVVFVHLIIYLV